MAKLCYNRTVEGLLMNLKPYKKYFVIITYAMILAFVLFHIKSIVHFFGNLFGILTPVWIGVALAFTLNVPMSIIEKEVFGRSSKGIRVFSLLSAITMVFFVFIILFVWVIPDFIDSATYLVGQLPTMMTSLNNFLLNTFRNTELSEYIKNFSGNSEVANLLSTVFSSLVTNFSSMLSNFVTFVVDLVTGIIIAVYFLFEKERILSVLNSFVDKIFDKKMNRSVHEVLSLANKSFHDFITYQCLECLILGVLMFISFVIFQFPYALTIAFLTAVTAIVPIFGATIACVIGAILIGTTSIQQAILFVVVFQVVQQIENNFIYPRVVGGHVGLPPVVTIIAILVGGKLAGFLGMILCIPITAIGYSLFITKVSHEDAEIELQVEKKKTKNARTAKKA